MAAFVLLLCRIFGPLKALKFELAMLTYYYSWRCCELSLASALA